MSTFNDLASSNPNLRAQYDDWRQQRASKNEDALDWGDFRAHVQRIGAPDPGNRPPDDWVGDDYKAANPDWDAKWRNA